MRAGPRQPSDLEAAFAHYWRTLAPDAPDPVREYRWCAETVGPGRGLRQRLADVGLRDWRFDFAWPRAGSGGVAVELHGATWTRGKHTRGQGFANDREKANLAQLDGWLVIELTADMLSGAPAQWIAAIADAVRRVR